MQAMEKSEEGKEVSTSILESRNAPSLTDVLGTQSKSELPQDPANDSLGSEFPALSHPSNTTSVTSSAATNTNAGASSSNTSQDRTLFHSTSFGADTHTNAGASSSNTSQETQMVLSSSNAGTHTNAGASSSNTSQETQIAVPSSNADASSSNTSQETQMVASLSNAGTHTNAGASSSNTSQETQMVASLSNAGTHTNAGASSSNTSQETQMVASLSNAGTHTNAGASSSNTSQETQIVAPSSNAGASSSNTSQETQMAASSSNAGTSGDSGVGDIGVNDAGIAVGASIGDHPLAPMYTLVDTIQQETGYIRSMAAGYNWDLFTGSDNNLVRMWRKGHAVEHFSSSSGPINAMLFQDPEAHIFCGHDDGAITVWERDTTGGVFKQIKRLQTMSDLLQKSISFTHDKAVSCLCLSGDGNFIYSGSKDCTVKVWRIRGSGTWKLVETIRDHKGPIYALATQASILSSASSDGTMKLWIRELYGKNEDKVRHELKRTCVFSGVVVNVINLGVNGFMYAGLSDGKVMSWCLYTMPINGDDNPEVMSIHKFAVTCLASLRFGPFVFSGSVDMTICVWRRQLVGRSYHPLHTLMMVLRGHSGPVRCIETNFDWEADATGARGQWIVYSASTDGALKVWRVYDRPLPRKTLRKSEHRLQVELRRLRSL